VSPSHVARSFRRHPSLWSLVVVVLAAAAWLAFAAASRSAASSSMPGMNMSEESMRRANEAWFAKHPPHTFHTTAAPVDSFVTGLTTFDADGNAATPIDTVTILVGQTVLFKYGSGVGHTCINGTGPTDPNMGTLFDMPLAMASQDFMFTFTSPGTVPFFCNLHVGLGMKGCVIVNVPAGVGGGPSARAGFVTSPWPNPSRSSVNVRFAMAAPGHARLDVVDAQGRRVASVLDRDFGAGESQALWDGRDERGQHVATGVYFMRLELPGLTQSRRVSITH